MNIHPGEVLLEKFLKPSRISQASLARSTGISRHRISALLRGKGHITANDAVRLSRFFGTSPEFWLHMMSHYELVEASLDPGLAEILPMAR